MKYLDLFSGIGGFTLGIQQAYEELCNNKSFSKIKQNRKGWNRNIDKSKILLHSRSKSPLCIGYSEIDKYAIQVYNKHFNHKNYGDITKINERELPDFDLLVGGFPCQSFSIAGKRAGFNDTRGTLFFEIARIIREKQPRLLLLENVKGLLSHDKGNTFFTIISTLDELGYDCQWQVLNSKNFGVPQNRERVFIIGHLRGTSRPEVFPITGGNSKTLKQIIGGGQGNRVYDISGISCTQASQAGVQGAKTGLYANTIDANYSRGNSLTKERHTDRTQIIKDNKVRRLTPRECERLQGFPDDWTEYGWDERGAIVPISDTQRYKMTGNAVTVYPVCEIMKKILVN